MSTAVLRLRRRPLLEAVQKLDAFEKVQETVREEKRIIGGTIFLICALLIIWLVISEFMYYTSTKLDYRFTVDTEFDTKMQIEIDIVVAMPCDTIGADILDVTDQPLTYAENQLKMDPVNFELSELKRQYWNAVREIKRKYKPGQPGLQSLLFINSDLYDEDEEEPEKTGVAADDGGQDDSFDANIVIIELDGAGGWQQRISPQKKRSHKQACRIHGFVRVNKVSGNLHITPGRSLPVMGGGHVHISQLGGPSYNFSHRIQKLAFGPSVIGMMNPLDGVEEITNDQLQMYQYYAQVVPTKVHRQFSFPVDTCQYAICKRHRSIDHSRGSHGMPGIYIKYEINPITVDVYETHQPYAEFAIRLCAIIGGVFATSGIINMLISGLFHVICCRWMTTEKRVPKMEKDGIQALANGHDSPAVMENSTLSSSNVNMPSNHTYGQVFIT